MPGYNPEQPAEAPPVQEARQEKEISPEAAKSHEQLGIAIQEFRDTSFDITKEGGKEVLVSKEGERFSVEQLENPSDKSVKEAHDLLMEKI